MYIKSKLKTLKEDVVKMLKKIKEFNDEVNWRCVFNEDKQKKDNK